MATVADISAFLEEKIPLSYKMDFDNVGFLCGDPDESVSKCLIALDVTMETIEEAAEFGAQLVLTHHPVIFQPMKSVRSDHPVGNRVIQLIRKNLSAICMHTNLDFCPGGVNDCLADSLGLKVIESIDIGRITETARPVQPEEFAFRLKETLHVQALRYSCGSRPVHRVALCSGAGGGLVNSAADYGCDTVLSGEIGYHNWLDGRARGLNLFEADHFCTEAVVLPRLEKILKSGFPEIQTKISRQTQASRGL